MMASHLQIPFIVYTPGSDKASGGGDRPNVLSSVFHEVGDIWHTGGVGL